MDIEDPLLWQLLLQGLLISLNAVFACAEIAVISFNDNKLERLSILGDKRATRLLNLTSKPAKFLATIQVGITLAGFLGSAFAAENFSDRLVDWVLRNNINIDASALDTMAVIAITIILSYFTLVLGELVPKRIAMKYAEKLALGMSGLIVFISKLFAPLVWVLTISTNALLRLLQIDPNAEDERITEEEIRLMVDVASEKGTIDADEMFIIHNVFEFDNKNAEEAMTHRTEVSLLWLEENDAEWEKTITESRHSHYPICDDGPDDIVGVLYAKDYFRLKDHSRENVLEKAVRPAQFVPESVRTDVLFRNMKNKRNHFAIVLDEYGGMSGVITMNDLLEQLVGTLDDDYTMEPIRPTIERVDSQTWSVSGSAILSDVAKNMGISLPIDEYDTFGGMVFGIMGSIPEDGQTPELEEYGLVIKIKEIREHRLEKALVTVMSRN